jgi:hypothetical protein
MKDDYYGRTIPVYHRINTGEAPPIRHLSSKLPLAKEAEVGEIL